MLFLFKPSKYRDQNAKIERKTTGRKKGRVEFGSSFVPSRIERAAAV